MADSKAYVLTVHSVTNINSSCKWYVKAKLAGKNKQKSKAFKPIKNTISFNETFYFPTWGDNVVVQLSVWKERRFTHVEVAHTELLCPCAPEYPECKYELKTELFPKEKKKDGEKGLRSRANTGLGGVDQNKPCGEITFTVIHTSGNKKYLENKKQEEEKKLAALQPAPEEEEKKIVVAPLSPASVAKVIDKVIVPIETAEETMLNRKRKLVQDSWEVVSSAKIKEQATRLLLGRWWELDASARALFQNSIVSEATGLMKNFGFAVRLLNSPSELRNALLDAGRKHASYGVKVEQFSTLGVALMWTLQIGLGSKWTKELEEAWLWAYSTFSSQMIEGLEQEHVVSSLIQNKKEIVSSWGLVKNAEDTISTLFYNRFFEIDPSAAALFVNVDMTQQKPLFINLIRALVDSLNDLEALESSLRDVGAKHKTQGLTSEHLENFSLAFMYTLKTGLGPACTAAVREAWSWLLRVLEGSVAPLLDNNLKGSIPLRQLMEEDLIREGDPKPVLEDLLSQHRYQIQASWDLLKNAEDTVATLFYGRFFEVDPSARELFSNVDMSAQKGHFVKTLRALVNHVSDSSKLESVLHGLGDTHKNYGIKMAHLDTFNATFLWTLQIGLGDSCTRECVEAWRWLLSVVAGVFRDHLEPDPAPKPAAAALFSAPISAGMKRERGIPAVSFMLSQYKKEIVSSWDLVKNAEETVATLLYGRYFEIDPSARELFKLIDLKQQKPLIMRMFRIIVNHLENNDLMFTVVKEMAVRHKTYGVKPSHFDTLGAAFLWTLQTGLGDGCTDVTREAWTWLFSVVSGIFKEVYEAPAPVPLKTPTVVSKGKQLIQNSWVSIEPIGDKAGILFFGCLFEADPSMRALFGNSQMTTHIKLFMKALSFAVANVDNPSVLVPHISTLAVQHANLGLTSRHFDSLGAALFQTFKIGLGDKWSESVREAWLYFYSELCVTMMDAIAEEHARKTRDALSPDLPELARKFIPDVSKRISGGDTSTRGRGDHSGRGRAVNTDPDSSVSRKTPPPPPPPFSDKYSPSQSEQEAKDSTSRNGQEKMESFSDVDSNQSVSKGAKGESGQAQSKGENQPAADKTQTSSNLADGDSSAHSKSTSVGTNEGMLAKSEPKQNGDSSSHHVKQESSISSKLSEANSEPGGEHSKQSSVSETFENESVHARKESTEADQGTS